MPVGLVTQIEFLDATSHSPDQLVVGGKGGCYIIDLAIKFRYDAAMAIMLDPKGTSITLRLGETTKSEHNRDDKTLKDFDGNRKDRYNEKDTKYQYKKNQS